MSLSSAAPIQQSRDVLEHLLEGCQIIGRDFTYLYVNDAVARQGRVTREALLGRRMSEVYPGIEETPMFGVLRRCMEARTAERLENEFAFPDGSIGWFELRFRPVPEGVFILSLEITERKRAEAARQEAEERILHLNAVLRGIRSVNQLITRERDPQAILERAARLLVESRGFSLCGFVVLDGGRVTRTAFAGIASKRRALEEMVGRGELPECIRLVLEGNDVVARADAANACHGCPVNRDFTGPRDTVAVRLASDGATLGAMLVVVPRGMASDPEEIGLLQEAAGDVAFALATIARLEDSEAARRKTEEELRLSQRLEAVGRLAGGVAHDFNNMLSVILGYARLALDEMREGDPLRDEMVEIQKAGQRAAALTRQLLAFSRRQVLKPEVVCPNAIVRDMGSMLRRLIGEDVELALLFEADVGHVKADPSQLEQVIMNLAVNARDAMPRGGKLTIETANADLDEAYAERHVGVQPGPYVTLAVTDTGCGMDAQTLAHAFEPFFTTKETGKGSGLGLATVYGIVKQSGGNIWVYSEPGRGTSFKIHLPRVRTTDEVGHAAAPPPVHARGAETVLVVEDEDAVRRLAVRILAAAGYTVISAANGGEALLACERHRGPIDLLLTDVVMPTMSGRELADRLAALRPGLRVLFMSGYTANSIVHHGALDAGTCFIEKPFSSSDLVNKVAAVLARAG